MSRDARVVVLVDEPIGRIHPTVYGHFAEHLGGCIDGGIWVGEESSIPNTGGIRLDVLKALKTMKPSVVRWPGGCFADEYHWEDGVGPRDKRPKRVNSHWGQVIETNAFGTNEFMAFCRLIGAEPYLCGNLGSGSPAEMSGWVEYCNFPGDSTRANQRALHGHPEPYRVKTWGVGNENWGCGGHFDPEDYASEYRRFATFLHDYRDQHLFLIACGPCGNDVNWTQKFFAKLAGKRLCHGFAGHYYCGTAGTATTYSEDQFLQLLKQAQSMERLVVQQRAAMDAFDPDRRVSLIIDEWGTWHPPTEGKNRFFLWQQNTMRDALVAGLTLDIFNRHADKVMMANIAQTVNVLQAVILTEEDKMLITPTGHVYSMYAPHQDGTSLRMIAEADDLSFQGVQGREALFGLAGSCSLKEKTLFLSLINPSPSEEKVVTVHLRGATSGEAIAQILHHQDIHARNEFGCPEEVIPRPWTRVKSEGVVLSLVMPAASVGTVTAELV